MFVGAMVGDETYGDFREYGIIFGIGVLRPHVYSKGVGIDHVFDVIAAEVSAEGHEGGFCFPGEPLDCGALHGDAVFHVESLKDFLLDEKDWRMAEYAIAAMERSVGDEADAAPRKLLCYIRWVWFFVDAIEDALVAKSWEFEKRFDVVQGCPDRYSATSSKSRACVHTVCFCAIFLSDTPWFMRPFRMAFHIGCREGKLLDWAL